MSDSTTPTTHIVPAAYAAAVRAQKTKNDAIPARRLTITEGDTVRYVVTGPSFGAVEQECAKVHGAVPVGHRAIFRAPIPNGPGNGWIAAGYLA